LKKIRARIFNCVSVTNTRRNGIVFAHGSLYVALSRVTDPRNLRVCLPEGEHLPRGERASAPEAAGAVTVNVTFREVLD